uniref:Uncharacterized protein n=1 Tax=viral metagenome TaxID=1070528 RepID=A0A6C0M0J1_9ZZZZ
MSLESYHFSDDIYSDLVEKTREICNLLKLDDNHETILLDNIKQFHFETRDNMDIIRYFIKRREVKLFQMLFEKNIQMPLRDHIGCQDSDKVWRYLHLAYLLYENAHENPQPEVQVALINKLEESMKESNTEVENKTDKIPDPSLLMSSLMGSLMNRGSNEGGPDLGKLINGEGDLGKLMGSLMGGMGGGEGPDLGKLMGSLMGGMGGGEGPDLGKLMGSLMGGMGGGSNLMEDPDILTKGMDPIMEHLGLKDTSSNLSNPAMVTDIMSEIKDNLKNSGKNVNQLIEKTMEMGQKYQDKIKSGELSMEEMMGSLMGVLKNPETLMETMKDMDLSNLPDPTTMISSLMGSGLNMGGDLNIDSILSQVMGSNKSSKEQDKDTTPLTNEQLKELEEFYSNLNLK